jgi:hypothetical protein
MVTTSQPAAAPADQNRAGIAVPMNTGDTSVTMLTGGFDRPSSFGLTMEMISKGVSLELGGSYEIDGPEMHTTLGLRFPNLQDSKQEASFATKATWTFKYYARLIRYADL